MMGVIDGALVPCRLVRERWVALTFPPAHTSTAVRPPLCHRTFALCTFLHVLLQHNLFGICKTLYGVTTYLPRLFSIIALLGGGVFVFWYGCVFPLSALHACFCVVDVTFARPCSYRTWRNVTSFRCRHRVSSQSAIRRGRGAAG